MQVIDETRDDLLELLRNDWGTQVTQSHVDEFFPHWLTHEARKIAPVARNVLISARVDQQKATFPAIFNIEHALAKGIGVSPYLSKSIFKKPPKPSGDRFFLDWQMSHFHLGDEFVDTRSVQRTKPVLLVYIDDESAMLLDVKLHGGANPNVWVEDDLLTALKEVAPEVLQRFEIKNVAATSWTPTPGRKKTATF
jgi:hypothetical protein